MISVQPVSTLTLRKTRYLLRLSALHLTYKRMNKNTNTQSVRVVGVWDGLTRGAKGEGRLGFVVA